MNKAITLIFPHQLFEESPALAVERPVYLIEAQRYWSDFAFHKQKLIFHRASMKAYEQYLKEKKYTVHYIAHAQSADFFKKLPATGEVHYVDPVDTKVEQELLGRFKEQKLQGFMYESPAFLCSRELLEKEFANKDHFHLYTFYVGQRKRLKILIDKQGKPLGGSWSLDKENRKPLPDDIEIPSIKKVPTTQYVTEAIAYVEKEFPQNPGDAEPFIYPVTFAHSYAWFEDFLKHRLKLFGPYQDAIKHDESILFHSLLSPLINVGLLTPQYVVEQTLAYAQKHQVPIASLEGFIRQIIGWREFVRGVYVVAGERQRTTNFFEHARPLPRSFWTATTGIMPLDSTIQRLLATSYAHHIERLMLLGNFMLLTETNPDDVYTWFMELFIDAYDWVMVPNVYGMSQYADGGLMVTKPYISGSAYINRMSDFKKGEWQSLWDSLYWHFVYKHREMLAKNARLKMMALYLKRMKPEKIKEHVHRAQAYLQQ